MITEAKLRACGDFLPQKGFQGSWSKGRRRRIQRHWAKGRKHLELVSFLPLGGVPGLWGKIGEKLSGCGNFISWLGVEACNVDEEMGAPLTWGS